MGKENNTFFDYLYSKSLESHDNTSLIRMYKMYVLTEKIIEKDPINANKILEEYEEKVYTIGEKKIPKIKRIELEIKRISKCIDKKDNITLEQIKSITTELNKIKDMLKQIDEFELDNSLLEYVKKRISVMQATLGLNNTFLKETHDVFIENYRNLYINNINNDNFVEQKKKK